MELLDEMLSLLQEKTALFIQYENVTKKLITDDPEAVEDIVAAMENRQDMIDEINGIDVKIERIRETSKQGRRYYEIGKNRCDYSRLEESERRLFDEGQQIFSTITRVKELEDRAAVSMNAIRDFLQEKIRQSNTNVKFTGYLKQMEQGSKGVLYNKKR